MSNVFYHYQQRCEELERALAAMTAERDHYFTAAEDYRCNTPTATRKESGTDANLDWAAIFAYAPEVWATQEAAADPMLVQMEKALDGIDEVTIHEAIAAMGLHEPTRSTMVRAMSCLRKMGWQKIEKRGTTSRFVFRRKADAAEKATDAKTPSITQAIQSAWDQHSQRAPYQWPSGCGGFICLQSPPLMAETAFAYAVEEILLAIGISEATHNDPNSGAERGPIAGGPLE